VCDILAFFSLHPPSRREKRLPIPPILEISRRASRTIPHINGRLKVDGERKRQKYNTSSFNYHRVMKKNTILKLRKVLD
jgi:hypothetical protein